MPKRGENIRKRSDGRWEGRYIYKRELNGKAKYRSVYANTYAEVKQKLEAEKGEDSISKKRTEKPIKTFSDLAKQWLSACEINLKYSTIVKYSFILEKHILPWFGDLNPTMVTEEIVGDFLKSKSTELSCSSLHTLLIVTKAILKYAYKHGCCSRIDIDLRVPAVRKGNVVVLSKVERECLENFLLEEMDSTKLGFYLCLSTGLRIGELCALKWENIDISQGILHVNSTLQRIKAIDGQAVSKTKLMITSPKSISSIRDIPLPHQLSETLYSFKRTNESFLLSGNCEPVEPRTMQYRFNKYAERLNLSYSNPHVLRHTFATHCIELGFDVKTLSEILGHSSVEITLNRYVHSSEERKRLQMSLLFANSGQNCGINIS